MIQRGFWVMRVDRFTLDVREVFNGHLARLFDNDKQYQVVTIQVGHDGSAFDGQRIWDDLFTAANAAKNKYLRAEQGNEQIAQQFLDYYAAPEPDRSR